MGVRWKNLLLILKTIVSKNIQDGTKSETKISKTVRKTAFNNLKFSEQPWIYLRAVKVLFFKYFISNKLDLNSLKFQKNKVEYILDLNFSQAKQIFRISRASLIFFSIIHHCE